jgi:hypothetical protein
MCAAIRHQFHRLGKEELRCCGLVTRRRSPGQGWRGGESLGAPAIGDHRGVEQCGINVAEIRRPPEPGRAASAAKIAARPSRPLALFELL